MTDTRRDIVTDGGILVVGLAAAVLTFTTLSELGRAVGFTAAVLGFQLAWLLPVTIDAAGIVAARVWLRDRASDEAVAYARKLALACIGLSVVFNGGWHLIDLAGIAAPWWVVLPVTSVPPAVLAAVVHLGHLIYRTARTVTPEIPEIPEDPDGPEVPARTVAEAWAVFHPSPGPDGGTDTPDGPDGELPVTPDRPALHAVPSPRTDTPDGHEPSTPVTPPDLRTVRPDEGDGDELVPAVRAFARTLDRPLSAKAVRSQFGVGHERAVRLVTAAKEEDR